MGSGGVTAGVEDAKYAVGSLPGKGDLAVNGIEGHAQVDQVGDARRAFVGQNAYRCDVTQPVSRR